MDRKLALLKSYQEKSRFLPLDFSRENTKIPWSKMDGNICQERGWKEKERERKRKKERERKRKKEKRLGLTNEQEK